MSMCRRSGRAVLACRLLGASSLVIATACGSEPDHYPGFETGPLMRPGDDCSRCHSAGSAYPKAPHWSVAGTVYATPSAAATDGLEGVRVAILGEGGSTLETLSTNAVGNFYTATAFEPGFRVAIEYQGERVEMPCAPPAGNCGACHSQPPIGGPLGRIAVPQGLPARTGTFDCTSWSRK